MCVVRTMSTLIRKEGWRGKKGVARGGVGGGPLAPSLGATMTVQRRGYQDRMSGECRSRRRVRSAGRVTSLPAAMENVPEKIEIVEPCLAGDSKKVVCGVWW